MDYYNKYNKKIFFNQQAFNIQIIGNNSPMLSLDNIATLEVKIKFFLDIKAQKIAIVLINPISIY